MEKEVIENCRFMTPEEVEALDNEIRKQWDEEEKNAIPFIHKEDVWTYLENRK